MRRLYARNAPLLALLTALGCTSSDAPSAEAPPTAADERPAQVLSRVQSLAQQCCDATRNGEFEAVAALTLPKIVELIGGRDRMMEAMRADFSAPGAPELLEMTAGTPLPLCEFGQYTVTFVPTATTIRLEGSKKLQAHTHMLAVSSDDGTTWHFMSGNKQTRERIRYFLPEFPDSIAIPTNDPPVVLEE